MSAVARATSRIKRVPGVGASTLTRAPILRRLPILTQSSSALGVDGTVRSIATPARRLGEASQRRWASSAAAKAVEEGQEEVWPERVLPVLSAKDGERLRRQRNVGMYVTPSPRILHPMKG